LNHLKKFPYALGKLTIHSLLELRNQYLNLYEFNDSYLQLRQLGTESSLSVLNKHLNYVDSLEPSHKDEEIIRNLLAANSFQMTGQNCSSFVKEPYASLEAERYNMQPRPWLRDDMDQWKCRMKNDKPHQKVVIFVDKCGVDIVLGVFPFARHLLSRGSKVILAANTGYARNDILHDELVVLADKVAEMCPIINKSLIMGDLKIMETGSCSLSLQLRVIENRLVKAMQNVDLVVLVGVDRAIYTNFEEEFTCESIHCAIIKDAWLANHLGGQVNDVVFKYQQPCGKRK